jgi:hypothetical protein
LEDPVTKPSVVVLEGRQDDPLPVFRCGRLDLECPAALKQGLAQTLHPGFQGNDRLHQPSFQNLLVGQRDLPKTAPVADLRPVIFQNASFPGIG